MNFFSLSLLVSLLFFPRIFFDNLSLFFFQTNCVLLLRIGQKVSPSALPCNLPQSQSLSSYTEIICCLLYQNSFPNKQRLQLMSPTFSTTRRSAGFYTFLIFIKASSIKPSPSVPAVCIWVCSFKPCHQMHTISPMN